MKKGDTVTDRKKTRWWWGREKQEQNDLINESLERNCSTIEETLLSISASLNKSRKPVKISGRISSTVFDVKGRKPKLIMQLQDGSGTVELVFFGRRKILGLEPGKCILVEGTMNTYEDKPAIYNPKYTIVPNSKNQ